MKQKKSQGTSGWAAVVAIGLLTVAGGCDPRVRVERVQVGDTVVVSTKVARVDTAELEVSARYVFRPSGPDTVLPTVTALALGDDGRVYAATDDGVIHRFEPHGALEHTFRIPHKRSLTKHASIRALVVEADGSVLTREANGNIQRFSAEGKQTGAWMAGPAEGLTTAQLLTRGVDGKVRIGLSAQQVAPAQTHGVPILAQWNPPDQPRDTFFARSRWLQRCGPPPSDHFRSGTFLDIRTRYLPSPQWAPLPSGGVVAGCNAEYLLDVTDQQGKVTRVTHARALVPVSADENKSFVKAWTLRMRSSPARADWSWQGDSLPDRKPAYHRVLTASDGRIWVWPAQPSRNIPAPPQWVLVGGPRTLWVEPASGAFDVFAADGSFLGCVALQGELGYAPFGTTAPPVIRGDTLWLVALDSSGASALVRAQVRWPRAHSLRAWARHGTRATRDANGVDGIEAGNGQRGTIGTPTLLHSGSHVLVSGPRLRTHSDTRNSHHAQLNWRHR